MKIRCIAVDDEPLALEQLVTYIGKVPFLELAARCQSAVEARRYLEENTVDAIFCDISMPDLNGLDFVESLEVPPLVVFTTAYSEYAVDGFRLNAVDYLLKPFGLQEFRRAAARLEERLSAASSGQNAAQQDFIFLRSNGRIVKVDFASIRYVEGMSEYLKVWVAGEQKPIITLLSIKKIEEYLPDSFMRIHRSYIVNCAMIQEVSKNRIVLDEGTSLPLGDNYKNAFLAYVERMLVEK